MATVDERRKATSMPSKKSLEATCAASGRKNRNGIDKFREANVEPSIDNAALQIKLKWLQKLETLVRRLQDADTKFSESRP